VNEKALELYVLNELIGGVVIRPVRGYDVVDFQGYTEIGSGLYVYLLERRNRLRRELLDAFKAELVRSEEAA